MNLGQVCWLSLHRYIYTYEGELYFFFLEGGSLDAYSAQQGITGTQDGILQGFCKCEIFSLVFIYTYYFLFANFTYEGLHIPRVFECCNFILKRCVCVQGVREGDGGSLPPPTPPPIMQVVHILRIKIEWCQ